MGRATPELFGGKGAKVAVTGQLLKVDGSIDI